MLRKKIPRQVPLTVLLVASKCVGERIDQGVSEDMWSGKMAPYLNKITRAFWERSALKGLANKRDYPLYLRNYRVFIVYGQTPKRMNQQFQDEISQLRSTIKVSLEAARIETKNCTVNDFLSVMRELTNYREEQVMSSSNNYNEFEELHRQIPETRQDTGQTKAMGVSAFPALFLVSPRSKDYRALAYGFMTQDDLAKRFLNVATGFKPNF